MPRFIKNLNLPEVYIINCIDFNMIDTMQWLPIERGELGYENRFHSRPISCGSDLSCFRTERLPELHSAAPSGRHRGTVHGRPVRIALPVGDLRLSGRRSG